MADASGAASWALKAHAACDWIFWVVTINVLWAVFTIAGGVVLGVAPATAAAAELTRRRLRGEVIRALPSFAAAWRSNFRAANLVLLPVQLVGALLILNVLGMTTAGSVFTPLGFASLGALAIVVVLGAVSAGMFANYDLPLRAYVLTASRWMLLNIAHVVLFILLAVVIVTASLILPGLIPFVSVGAWLVLSTTFCMAFFRANDEQVAARAEPTQRADVSSTSVIG